LQTGKNLKIFEVSKVKGLLPGLLPCTQLPAAVLSEAFERLRRQEPYGCSTEHAANTPRPRGGGLQNPLFGTYRSRYRIDYIKFQQTLAGGWELRMYLEPPNAVGAVYGSGWRYLVSQASPSAIIASITLGWVSLRRGVKTALVCKVHEVVSAGITIVGSICYTKEEKTHLRSLLAEKFAVVGPISLGYKNALVLPKKWVLGAERKW